MALRLYDSRATERERGVSPHGRTRQFVTANAMSRECSTAVVRHVAIVEVAGSIPGRSL